MTIPPYAIVNLKSTKRPVDAIKYFANPKKVVAVYDGLDVGVAKGSPKELAENLLAFHHDPRTNRVCRTAVISVQTPPGASKSQLSDIDRRLLGAAKDFQKFMGIASMLGWVHQDTLTRHIHLIFCNSNGRRTLDLRPKFLKELQGFLWTLQFASGRGKGKRRALPMYTKSKRLDVRVLAVALLGPDGKVRQERWDKLVKAGNVSELRHRKDGSIISFQFQGRRIRFATLKNFLGLLGGQTSDGSAGGNHQTGENMTNIINALEPLPADVTESLHGSGFTSADVQEILKDIREAQQRIVSPAKLVAIATPQHGIEL